MGQSREEFADLDFLQQTIQRVLRRFGHYRTDYCEWLGVAWIAYHEAQQRWDPDRTADFHLYAGTIIFQRMIDTLRSQLPGTRRWRKIVEAYYESRGKGEALNNAYQAAVNQCGTAALRYQVAASLYHFENPDEDTVTPVTAIDLDQLNADLAFERLQAIVEEDVAPEERWAILASGPLSSAKHSFVQEALLQSAAVAVSRVHAAMCR